MRSLRATTKKNQPSRPLGQTYVKFPEVPLCRLLRQINPAFPESHRVPFMKYHFGLCALSLALVVPVFAVKIGDTYQQVLFEKGKPAGVMQVGATQILRYPDQTVKLKSDHVIALEPPPREASVVHVIAPPPTAAKAKSAQTGIRKTTATWGTDFDAAVARAKAEDRKVFMFFTGSDWCGSCQRLQKEILTQPEFSQYASEKLVLLEVDFPQRTPLSEAQKASNQALAQRYRIDGYPTIIVLGSDGNTVGRLGYQEGGPAPFIEALKRF